MPENGVPLRVVILLRTQKLGLFLDVDGTKGRAPPRPPAQSADLHVGEGLVAVLCGSASGIAMSALGEVRSRLQSVGVAGVKSVVRVM
eukprot:3588555-Heterocapsa_arctica.AAC.1